MPLLMRLPITELKEQHMTHNTVAIFTSPMSFIKWATALEQKGYAVTVKALNGRLFASATRS